MARESYNATVGTCAMMVTQGLKQSPNFCNGRPRWPSKYLDRRSKFPRLAEFHFGRDPDGRDSGWRLR
jgi:hypothetical protein